MILSFFGNNYEVIHKLKEQSAKLKFAVEYLNSLVAQLSIRPQKQYMFDKKLRWDKPILPYVELLDDPFPIMECSTDIYRNQNKITISTGLFYFLYLLGPFEKKMDEIAKYQPFFFDEIEIMDKEDLKACVEDMLGYLKKAYEAPETVELPELTLSEKTFAYALEFIFGHEISHYLDLSFDRDARIDDQLDIWKTSIEAVTANALIFRSYAIDLFLNRDLTSAEMQYMSEELLADFQGFQYACEGRTKGRVGRDFFLSVSLGFIAMEVLEYFLEQTRTNTDFMIPTLLREELLAYNVNKRLYEYDTFQEFLQKEWGTFTTVKILFFCVMPGTDFKEKENAGVSMEEAAKEAADLFLHMSADSEKRREAVKRIEILYNTYQQDRNIVLYYAQSLIRVLPIQGIEETAKTIFKLEYLFRQHDHIKDLICVLPVAMNWLGKSYMHNGNNKSALSWFQRAGHWFQETNLAEESAENSKLMFELYFQQNDFTRALTSIEQCLKIRRSVFDAHDIRIAEAYNCIGITCYHMGEFDRALDNYHCALAIELMHEPDFNTALLYHNMGLAVRDSGRWDAAREYFYKALKIKCRLCGAFDSSMADSYFGLAGCCYFGGDYKKARKLLLKTVKIYEDTLGAEHPNTMAAREKYKLLQDKEI